MELTRMAHKAIARAGGYFWLPCPVCGENFGGHEWTGEYSLMMTPDRGKGVCNKPSCQEVARQSCDKFKDVDQSSPEELARRRIRELADLYATRMMDYGRSRNEADCSAACNAAEELDQAVYAYKAAVIAAQRSDSEGR